MNVQQVSARIQNPSNLGSPNNSLLYSTRNQEKQNFFSRQEVKLQIPNQESIVIQSPLSPQQLINISQPVEREQKATSITVCEVLKKLRFQEKVQSIQEMSTSYRYRNLRQDDFEMIGDQAFDFNTHLKLSKKSGKAVLKIDSPYSIDPDGGLSSFFSLIFGICGFIKFFLAPIYFSFYRSQTGERHFDTLNWMCFFIFALQIISGFFISRQRKNDLITNSQEIRQYYLKEEFLNDILPLLQIILNFKNDYPILGIIYVSSIFQFARCIRKFCDFFHIEEQFVAAFHIARLVLLIFSVAHYNALAFFLVSDTGHHQDNWATSQHLEDASFIDIYEKALYFIIITMITVGYGDVQPVTSRERIYIIIMTIFSCFLFGYAVNTVGTIFQQQDLRDTALRAVDPQMSRKVLREIEYINSMEQNGLFDENIDLILDKVSSDLKLKVKENISLKILRSCHLLNNTLSLKCLSEYTEYMKEQTLTPSEILFQKGVKDDRIYFINTGQIQIYIDNGEQRKEILLTRIKEKSFIGESTFLSQQDTETNARSVGVTHVIYFEYQDLMKILSKYPDDFEKLRMKKDVILYNLEQNENKQRCNICYRIGHMITKCPRITYRPDKNLICRKSLMESYRLRHQIRRKNSQFQCHKTFQDLDKMRNSLMNFRKDMVQVFDENSLDISDQNHFENDREFFLKYPQILLDDEYDIYLDTSNASAIQYQDPTYEVQREKEEQVKESSIENHISEKDRFISEDIYQEEPISPIPQTKGAKLQTIIKKKQHLFNQPVHFNMEESQDTYQSDRQIRLLDCDRKTTINFEQKENHHPYPTEGIKANLADLQDEKEMEKNTFDLQIDGMREYQFYFNHSNFSKLHLENRMNNDSKLFKKSQSELIKEIIKSRSKSVHQNKKAIQKFDEKDDQHDNDD